MLSSAHHILTTVASTTGMWCRLRTSIPGRCSHISWLFAQSLLPRTGIPWSEEHFYNYSRLQEGPAMADFVFFGGEKKFWFSKATSWYFYEPNLIRFYRNIRMLPVYPDMRSSKTATTALSPTPCIPLVDRGKNTNTNEHVDIVIQNKKFHFISCVLHTDSITQSQLTPHFNDLCGH